ncbi:nucleoside hydrolase [Micromonospora sediminimaris]|uniref:Inosine-uridine preferring nucleoside hydrolase n=1 Tax=Micromonospora sediminimaris TaxID=547162 RepID=A0A9W5XMH9_9ACTN|nr:nucleoside hydrolase [Micromonospora sediminimaris]GIJ34803.1 inosine-uridine preferring nucleoside hydrolase [Micromonospora sediminimaris]SFD51978.1 purine nucleosidase [Micromonospora sediminimaris]
MTETRTPARAVIMDHDGSLDDLLSLLLLTRYDVDLQGVAVTPADCLLAPALSVTHRILDLADLPHVQVAPGSLSGPHPFPMAWRTDALRVEALPVLNRFPPRERTSGPVLPAHEQLVKWIEQAATPLTILVTGPLTNLAWCLDKHPWLEQAIGEIVFMGGAFDVEGNVEEPGHDGSAEWNVYCDPKAAQRVFATQIPITLFPLDVTNQVPVTDEFVRAFGAHYGNPASDLAGSLLAMTFGTVETVGSPYCCWDSLATSYLAAPELFTFDQVRCTVVVDGASEGRTVRADDGRVVRCAITVKQEDFYRHCLQLLT